MESERSGFKWYFAINKQYDFGKLLKLLVSQFLKQKYGEENNHMMFLWQ